MYDRNLLKDLPVNPGIYMMKNINGEIIYVGKAKNLKNRVRQYFQHSKNLNAKTIVLVSHIESIETIIVDSEMEALILECNLIKAHRPKYNILLKDDKNYPYIKITVNEIYPRILMTRSLKKDGGKYFGPFTSSYAVKKTVEAIQKTYHLRRCRREIAYGNRVGRPCLNYHIGQCNAPCQGKIQPLEYMKEVDEVLEILMGKDSELVTNIKQKMILASEKQDYELAAKFRDQLTGIAHIVEKQKIISTNRQDQDMVAFSRLNDIACVQVFNIRDGKMLGKDHVYMEGVEEVSPEEVMTTFVKQYYGSKPFIPKEIVLNEGLLSEEKSTIEVWLNSLKGSKVTLTIPQKGNKSKMLHLVKENADITLQQYDLQKKAKESQKKSRLDSISMLLGLDTSPKRIEAYDISNIGGSNNVGGMVVFTDGRSNKKDYRRFRIKSVDGQNDYASMQEMIFRRIERGIKEQKEGIVIAEASFLPFPELICIDGGQAHVDAANSIINMYPEIQIKICGLVKDNKHQLRGVMYNGDEYPIKKGTPLCTFLNEISEEVHRYALSYHQNLRKKGMLTSELSSIAGVGPKRRQALLLNFKNIEAIKQARVDELMKIPEIDKKTALSIRDYFNPKGKEDQ